MKQDLIRLSGIIRESIVDGTGLRYVIFAQGCPHRCQGCHNPESHDFGGGKMYSRQQIIAEIAKNKLLDGITLSGGEPFNSAAQLLDIVAAAKGMGLNIWAYSGYTFEELIEMSQKNSDIAGLLQLCDVLVDGRFILEQRSLALKFRGSKNQRIIDVKKSLSLAKVVEHAV